MAMPRNSVWRVDIIRKGYSNKAGYYFEEYSSDFFLHFIFLIVCNYNIQAKNCQQIKFIVFICSVFEPPRGKTNNVVSEQVRLKPACTSTEKS